VLGWFADHLGGPSDEDHRRQGVVVDELGSNRVFAKIYTDEG